MKKILFVSFNDHVPWGGSEELWSQTALTLTKHIEVSVLIKKWEQQPDGIRALEKAGAIISYKPYQNRPSKQSIMHRFTKKLGLIKPEEKHQNFDFSIYDLVVFSLGNHLEKKVLDYFESVKSTGVPYVIVCQLVTDLRNTSDTLLNRFSALYTQARKVYLLSQENKTKLELQIAQNLGNVAFVNNPFYYSQQYVELHLDAPYKIACVAALTSFHKGQDLLIKVLSQEKWKTRDIVLNVYGDGHNRKQLEQLIALYGLQEKVILKGHVADKEDIWKYNSVCIMPSRMEGQSLAMLEAMSCGRAVIATDVGDVTRLVQPDVTGFVIDAPTISSIDKTLEKAWDKREQWKTLGVQARAHLYKEITMDPTTYFKDRLLDLL